jgi:hypothetical protein
MIGYRRFDSSGTMQVGRKAAESRPGVQTGASERFASSLGEPTKPLAPLFFERLQILRETTQNLRSR